MGKRADAPDTVDLPIHYLAKLQAEGWVVAAVEHTIDYGEVARHGRRLPIGATLVVHLVPQ